MHYHQRQAALNIFSSHRNRVAQLISINCRVLVVHVKGRIDKVRGPEEQFRQIYLSLVVLELKSTQKISFKLFFKIKLPFPG